ncbi:hypothetical protein [Streptomyces yangpuensis]|uniref:hypothetical protein n=1 Tax=Streptomyces yangpuensis TaxID=1648182 RepID=UPI003669A7C8
MPEGGEQHQSHFNEQQSEPVQRLPIESVQTRELADQNLVAYVTGEIAHKEAEQGSLEQRAAQDHHRSPAGVLHEYLSDVRVALSNQIPQSPTDDPQTHAERWAAPGDVGRVQAAYELLAYSQFTPEREQREKAPWAWTNLRQEGVRELSRVKELGIGVEVTAKQGELLAKLAERAGIPYDRSQRFIPASSMFEALARQEPSGASSGEPGATRSPSEDH